MAIYTVYPIKYFFSKQLQDRIRLNTWQGSGICCCQSIDLKDLRGGLEVMKASEETELWNC